MINTANCLEIKNAHCGFKGKEVLYIESLDIPSEIVCFVVGPSGVGKSTLIETLGLMSDRILNKESCTFHCQLTDKTYDFNLLNGEKKEEIRASYLSFLFQENNLLENYSVLENILLGQINSGGISIRQIEDLMEEFQLPDQISNRNISELSGGQRKRVAFIRSLAKHFKIIFGDEPTGNLDLLTSKRVIDVLCRQMKESKRTAILVSHDLHLTKEFADLIVPIKYKDGIGVISNQNLIYRKGKDWKNHNGDSIQNIDNHLQNLLLIA